MLMADDTQCIPRGDDFAVWFRDPGLPPAFSGADGYTGMALPELAQAPHLIPLVGHQAQASGYLFLHFAPPGVGWIVPSDEARKDRREDAVPA